MDAPTRHFPPLPPQFLDCCADDEGDTNPFLKQDGNPTANSSGKYSNTAIA
ncbi:hypothetical protein [Agrobacterium leguminum]|uniref:hypothetical protein n=1 Tax=Agrobacterium leguminum TaxID=2792015 RepID=UPI003CE48B8E